MTKKLIYGGNELPIKKIDLTVETEFCAPKYIQNVYPFSKAHVIVLKNGYKLDHKVNINKYQVSLSNIGHIILEFKV